MEPFFLAVAGGQRLCIHHPPARAPRAALLYVHPWAEEMNKSRRMVALQARALAAQGFAVLQVDLHGCGDSSGELVDASWSGWLDDLAAALQWLRQRHDAPLWLWGLRSGALLAAQAAARLDTAYGLLLWQPAASGKALLQQFLRLKAAASLQGGAAKATLDAARAALAAGGSVEVAGYTLGAAVAQGLEAATLALPPAVRQVLWLEVTTRQPPALLPASEALVQAWQAAGHAVHAQAVAGPAFWQTQEIEDAPELLAATLAALQQATPLPAAA